MKSKEEILKGLDDMEVRKKAYVLDLCKIGVTPNSVVYDTELIRKMEVTDATIHALKWVLGDDAPPVKTPCSKCKDGECQCNVPTAG